VGVCHRHARALVPEDLHDGLSAGALLGELGAEGVSEAVGVDRWFAGDAEDSEGLADLTQ